LLEGDSNRIELRSESDAVRDLSSGSHVIAATAHTTPDTTRFTIIINGHTQGERRVWQETADTWRYEHGGDAFHFARTERLVLDAGGFPITMELDGQRIVWDRWIERYERRDGHARWTAHTESTLGLRWSRTLGDGEAEVSGPVYYAALHPVHDLGVLARLLLEREDRTLPLLPDGTARLEPAGERWVEVDGSRRRIRLYAVHGLDLKPGYVWLDDERRDLRRRVERAGRLGARVRRPEVGVATRRWRSTIAARRRARPVSTGAAARDPRRTAVRSGHGVDHPRHDHRSRREAHLGPSARMRLSIYPPARK
jgi:hypothetical protein